MAKSTSSQHLPSRDEFVAFWKDVTTFKLRDVAPLASYLGGLALAAIVSRLTDPLGRAAIPVLCGAIAYVIFCPILYWLIYWRLYDRFIRCPQCRDWVGSDLMDRRRMWRIRPDPKWVRISKTGCCPKCGAQMLVMEEEQETSGGGWHGHFAAKDAAT